MLTTSWGKYGGECLPSRLGRSNIYLDSEKWKNIYYLSESFFTNVDRHHDDSTPKSKVKLESTSEIRIWFYIQIWIHIQIY